MDSCGNLEVDEVVAKEDEQTSKEINKDIDKACRAQKTLHNAISKIVEQILKEDHLVLIEKVKNVAVDEASDVPLHTDSKIKAESRWMEGYEEIIKDIEDNLKQVNKHSIYHSVVRNAYFHRGMKDKVNYEHYNVILEKDAIRQVSVQGIDRDSRINKLN